MTQTGFPKENRSNGGGVQKWMDTAMLHTHSDIPRVWNLCFTPYILRWITYLCLRVGCYDF